MLNGLKVTIIPYGDVPKVTVDIIVRSGNLNEAKNQVWLADITGDMMKEGTKTRTADQVAEEAAGMGGAITINVGPDQTQISSDALSEFGPKIVALLADVIENPLLPDSELPRLKKDAVRKMTIDLSQPNNVARQHFVKLVYPDHPYGRLYPTESMINSYSIDDIRTFYSKNLGAARTHVYIAGKFDSATMRKAVTDAFTKWPHGPEPQIDVPKPSTGRAFELTDKPGAVQSTVYVGLPVLDPSNPDYTNHHMAAFLNEIIVLAPAMGPDKTMLAEPRVAYLIVPTAVWTTILLDMAGKVVPFRHPIHHLSADVEGIDASATRDQYYPVAAARHI